MAKELYLGGIITVGLALTKASQASQESHLVGVIKLKGIHIPENTSPKKEKNNNFFA
jgi:hypothetical protein